MKAKFELPELSSYPGIISDRLKEALGIGTSGRIPPPWLINMQRYGPPPSYPGLKIPGLNVAIPSGCRFGYGPGEWGKPPVDHEGRGLYGDVFGVHDDTKVGQETDEEVDKTFEWGKVEDVECDILSENDEEDNTQTLMDSDGIHSAVTGISSLVPQSMETARDLTLRKNGTLSETTDSKPKKKSLNQSTDDSVSTEISSDHNHKIKTSSLIKKQGHELLGHNVSDVMDLPFTADSIEG